MQLSGKALVEHTWSPGFNLYHIKKKKKKGMCELYSYISMLNEINYHIIQNASKITTRTIPTNILYLGYKKSGFISKVDMERNVDMQAGFITIF